MPEQPSSISYTTPVDALYGKASPVLGARLVDVVIAAEQPRALQEALDATRKAVEDGTAASEITSKRRSQASTELGKDALAGLPIDRERFRIAFYFKTHPGVEQRIPSPLYFLRQAYRDVAGNNHTEGSEADLHVPGPMDRVREIEKERNRLLRLPRVFATAVGAFAAAGAVHLALGHTPKETPADRVAGSISARAYQGELNFNNVSNAITLGTGEFIVIGGLWGVGEKLKGPIAHRRAIWKIEDAERHEKLLLNKEK